MTAIETPVAPVKSAKPLLPKSTAKFRQAATTPDPQAQAVLLDDAQKTAEEEACALAYVFLRKAIGVIAFALPFVLAALKWWIDGRGLQGSISAYYYTHLRNYFVGTLFALAVFFLSYQRRSTDKYRIDRIVSDLASAMAVGVAMFPTTDGAASKLSHTSKVFGKIHLGCAAVLFALLAVFALFLFTKSDQTDQSNRRKRERNLVYRICGGVIVACLIEMAVAGLAGWQNPALFWPESVAILAFATSWLVKGGFLGILADNAPTEGKPHDSIARAPSPAPVAGQTSGG